MNPYRLFIRSHEIPSNPYNNWSATSFGACRAWQEQSDNFTSHWLDDSRLAACANGQTIIYSMIVSLITIWINYTIQIHDSYLIRICFLSPNWNMFSPPARWWSLDAHPPSSPSSSPCCGARLGSNSTKDKEKARKNVRIEWMPKTMPDRMSE